MALPGRSPAMPLAWQHKDKGSNPRPQETWLQGRLVRNPNRRAGGGKGYDPGPEFRYESEINRNFKPRVAQKTGASEYKVREIPKSGNMMEMAKAMTFEESLAQGTRADDPRNWEFYYKEPSGSRLGATKGMTADERRSTAFMSARRRAEKEAKLAGQDVYETLRAEYQTAAIQDQMKLDRFLAAQKGGPGRFGSTRVARNVAQQKAIAGKQMVTRQAGRQTSAEIRGGGEGLFTGPSRQERAMARTRGTTTRTG